MEYLEQFLEQLREEVVSVLNNTLETLMDDPDNDVVDLYGLGYDPSTSPESFEDYNGKTYDTIDVCKDIMKNGPVDVLRRRFDWPSLDGDDCQILDVLKLWLKFKLDIQIILK